MELNLVWMIIIRKRRLRFVHLKLWPLTGEVKAHPKVIKIYLLIDPLTDEIKAQPNVIKNVINIQAIERNRIKCPRVYEATIPWSLRLQSQGL